MIQFKISKIFQSFFENNKKIINSQVTLDWEKAFVEIALNTTFPGVSMYPHAARSYSDVSTDAIFFDAIKLASGYMLMFIYTILMLGKLNAVEVKMYLAITGIASVGMGLMIGMGLSSALGFPYTPMHPAMPFLALGKFVFCPYRSVASVKLVHVRLSECRILRTIIVFIRSGAPL